MPPTLLFAYGLLMRDMRYHDSHLSGRAILLGTGSIEGRLVYLAEPDIPALLAGEGSVRGELYEIDDALLPVLDHLFGVREGQPERSEYVRRLAEVTLDRGEPREAWAYFMRAATQRTRYPDATLIEDGDWRRLDSELDPGRREKAPPAYEPA